MPITDDFFDHHSHCTVFCDQQSSLLDVTASIIQGSAVGPAAYVVTAGDLTATTSGNSLCKFADDTYLIIPARNEASRPSELANIQDWAQLLKTHFSLAIAFIRLLHYSSHLLLSCTCGRKQAYWKWQCEMYSCHMHLWLPAKTQITHLATNSTVT